MSKRARYDGPDDEVRVYDPEQDVYAPPVAIVKQGGLLPADVPARIRDELVRRDNWTEVEHKSGNSKSEKE